MNACKLFQIVAVGCMAAALASCGGCANQTKGDGQNTNTVPTKTEQDIAAQGANVHYHPNYNIYIPNAPGRSGGPASQPSMSLNGFQDEGGPLFASATGSNTQAGLHVIIGGNVTVGNTTPTLTGTTTGSGTASLTQTPTATQRPDTSLSANLGAALPGGNVKQDATTAKSGGEGAGGPITQTPQTSATQTASNTETTTTSRPVNIAPPPLPPLPSPAPAPSP